MNNMFNPSSQLLSAHQQRDLKAMDHLCRSVKGLVGRGIEVPMADFHKRVMSNMGYGAYLMIVCHVAGGGDELLSTGQKAAVSTLLGQADQDLVENYKAWLAVELRSMNSQATADLISSLETHQEHVRHVASRPLHKPTPRRRSDLPQGGCSFEQEFPRAAMASEAELPPVETHVEI